MYFVYFEHRESICPGISIIFRALQNAIEIPVLTFNAVKEKNGVHLSYMFYVAKHCHDHFINMPFMSYFAFFCSIHRCNCSVDMVDSAQGKSTVGWSWARVESYLSLFFPLDLSAKAKFQLIKQCPSFLFESR